MISFRLLYPHLLIASTSNTTIKNFVTPVFGVMCALAGLVCVVCLIIAGIHYMTSTGQPRKLEHAKLIMRNAIIGLVIVLAAGTLTALLNHAYASSGGVVASKLPNLGSVKPLPASNGLVDILIKAVTGFLLVIIESAAVPFLKALSYFTTATPLIANNPGVFKLWLAMAGIADSLFIVVVALLGFHIMSYASLGLDEIEFKHLLPQIGCIFLLINCSVFLIDGIISFSNVLILALRASFSNTSVWNVLTDIVKQANGFSIAALLIMVCFLTLSVMLLVYYVGRLVSIYLGAVLAPLVLLLWLLPSFRDFAENAGKTYVATIFVLFIHVVILQLAASLLGELVSSSGTQTADPIMAMIVGLSTLIALLKTQGMLAQLSYARLGTRSIRKLSGQFLNSVNYTLARAAE